MTSVFSMLSLLLRRSQAPVSFLARVGCRNYVKLIGSRQELWKVVDYNATLFNPYKLVHILNAVKKLHLGHEEYASNPLLVSYLKRAILCSRKYVNIVDLKSGDIAVAILRARELKMPLGQELGDTLLGTIQSSLPLQTLNRVVQYCYSFSRYGICDPGFWEAAKIVVMNHEGEPIDVFHLVGLTYAFRKAGVVDYKVYDFLAKETLRTGIDKFGAGHVHTSLATFCRVDLSDHLVLQELADRFGGILRDPSLRSTVSKAHVMSVLVSLVRALGMVDVARVMPLCIDFLWNSNGGEELSAEETATVLWCLRQVDCMTDGEFFKESVKKLKKQLGGVEAARLAPSQLIFLGEAILSSSDYTRDDISALVSSLTRCLPQIDNCVLLSNLLVLLNQDGSIWAEHPAFLQSVLDRVGDVCAEASVEDSPEALTEVANLLSVVMDLPVNDTADRMTKVFNRAVDARSPEERKLLSDYIGFDLERMQGRSPADMYSSTMGTQEDLPGREEKTAAAPSLGWNSRSTYRESGEEFDDLFTSIGSSESLSEAHIDEISDKSESFSAHQLSILSKLLAEKEGSMSKDGKRGLSRAFEALGEAVVAKQESLSVDQATEILCAFAVADLPSIHVFENLTSLFSRSSEEGTAVPSPLQCIRMLEAASSLRLVTPSLSKLFHEASEAVGRLSSAHAVRLLSSSSRLGLCSPQEDPRRLGQISEIVDRILNTSVCDITCATAVKVMYSLYLSAAPPSDQQLSSLLSALDSTLSVVEHWQFMHFLAFILSHPDPFTRGLLSRLPVELQETHQKTMASQVPRLPSSPSDSTLRFHHQVTTFLSKAGRKFDLGCPLGPVAADLQLEDGSLLLLYGPESFYLPIIPSKGRLLLTSGEAMRHWLLSRMDRGLEAEDGLWKVGLKTLGEHPKKVRHVTWLQWEAVSDRDDQARISLLFG